MRPSVWLAVFVFGCLAAAAVMAAHTAARVRQRPHELAMLRPLVAGLGLSDLCLSTEARYTRHPAVSDPVVPVMDHPGAIEHLPSGSFFAPPR